MNATISTYESLSIVTVTGFEGKPRYDGDPDPIGSANYLCEDYGMRSDDGGPDEPGIIWTDYTMPGWQFSVLIDSQEVSDLEATAKEAGYTIGSIEPVTKPMHYGDYDGTCTICQSPDGWIVLT